MADAQAGEKAPDIREPAFGTRLVPDRAWVAGRPLVVLFYSRENQDDARAVTQVIRNKWRDAQDLVTINLIDLSMFQRLVRKLVNSDLTKAFDVEVANLPGDLDPESHIIIVPDFDGKMTRAWGVSDAAQVVNAVVVDAQWRICARARGAEVESVVMRALSAMVGVPR
ncbi:MAG: hypothetical protein ABSA53_06925 [Streptosporangiaceae bacterium]|jgi:hypothetical protein